MAEEELLINANLKLDKANAVDDGGAANNVAGVSESAKDQPESTANKVAKECERLLWSLQHIFEWHGCREHCTNKR